MNRSDAGRSGGRLKTTYRTIRSRWWSSLLMDGALVLIGLAAITQWQTRKLLPAGVLTQAPPFILVALDGNSYSLEQARGKPVLLYFFAPWCGVCHLSAGNLQDLRQSRSKDELVIYLVAIAYQNAAEVQAFADKHGLTMPVLLGNGQVAEDYHVEATPTYYTLDPQGRITHHSVGYSSELGMRFRTM